MSASSAPETQPAIPVKPSLLHLTPKDRAILTWVSNRARAWLTALKRRRKYLPRGAPYSPEEAQAIRALAMPEEGVRVLLRQGS